MNCTPMQDLFRRWPLYMGLQGLRSAVLDMTLRLLYATYSMDYMTLRSLCAILVILPDMGVCGYLLVTSGGMAKRAMDQAREAERLTAHQEGIFAWTQRCLFIMSASKMTYGVLAWVIGQWFTPSPDTATPFAAMSIVYGVWAVLQFTGNTASVFVMFPHLFHPEGKAPSGPTAPLESLYSPASSETGPNDRDDRGKQRSRAAPGGGDDRAPRVLLPNEDLERRYFDHIIKSEAPQYLKYTTHRLPAQQRRRSASNVFQAMAGQPPPLGAELPAWKARRRGSGASEGDAEEVVGRQQRNRPRQWASADLSGHVGLGAGGLGLGLRGELALDPKPRASAGSSREGSPDGGTDPSPSATLSKRRAAAGGGGSPPGGDSTADGGVASALRAPLRRATSIEIGSLHAHSRQVNTQFLSQPRGFASRLGPHASRPDVPAPPQSVVQLVPISIGGNQMHNRLARAVARSLSGTGNATPMSSAAPSVADDASPTGSAGSAGGRAVGGAGGGGDGGGEQEAEGG